MKIKKLKNYTSFILAFLILSSSAIAQEKLKDTIRLDEMVVTASKTLQAKGNITQKIEVVSNEDFTKLLSANRNICEVLQTQPGNSTSVLSRNDANWGTYGGIGSKYSTFMLNGLPVDAFVDPMTLDLSAFERIEVQRGPASVMYSNYLSQDFAGNQSPLAGTINLIPRERFENAATRISTSFGSYNTFNGQVYHQNKFERFHFYTGMNYEMSDYTDYGIENSWLNMKKNPEYKKTKLFGGVSWYSKNDDHKFTLFFNKTMHNGDAGRVYRGFDHNYTTINSGYNVRINKNLSLQANIGYRDYDRSWQESQFNVIDSLVSNNGVIQHIVPADISVSYLHFGKHVLTTGVDYQAADYETWSDPLLGYKLYGNKSTAMQTGVYAQEELHFGKVIARAGIRFNYIKNRIILLNSEPSIKKIKEWYKLLWSGGIKYNISKLVSIYANTGNSFMTPGLKSIGGTIEAGDTINSGQVPNPDLTPESGIGIDLGADFSIPFGITLNVRGFAIFVDDAIIENVIRQSPSQSMSVNAGKTNSLGGELQIAHQVIKDLKWFANFTYLNTTIKNPYDADQDGARVPFSPDIIANLGISYDAPFGLSVTPVVNFNNGFYDSSSKSGRNYFRQGFTLNTNLSMDVYRKEQCKITCFVNLYNITNNKYEMPWQFRNTGFSLMGGIKAEF